MNTIAITADTRGGVGKKAAKAVRDSGAIPCVMYGGATNITFSTNHKSVKGLVYTPEFKVAEITLDGAVHKCILKDIQFHPVTESILHMDFLKLEDGRPFKLEVPVRFKGTSPGVKSGGKLQQTLRKVKIKTTPENMVDALFADISEIKLGESSRVRDLEVPEGIEVLNSPGIPVLSVEVPRALKGGGIDGEEEEEEGGEEAAAAE